MKSTISASCSSDPDSRKSASIGWLLSLFSALLDNCDNAITGTPSSKAIVLRERDISDTSTWRDSTLLEPELTNCK